MVVGTVTSAAVPGAPAWDVVVGDRFIAAVAAPSPDACASALAAAAADDAVTIESLVGMVPLGGADAVDSFAIVCWPGPDTTEVTAVVRGDAVVDLASPGGTRRFDARGIRPWHLADFGAVIGLRITGAAAPLDRLGETTDRVGRSRASLRASVVEWSAAHAQAWRPDASAADADTALMPRAQHDDEVADADTILTTQRPPAAGGIAPDPEPDPLSPASAPPTAKIRTIELGRPSTPFADEDLLRSREPEPEPGTGRRPLAPDSDDRSPDEREGDRLFAVPAFRIGGGAPHPVTGPVLIGRRPLAPRIPDPAGAPELVSVASPRAVVSGTHLELRLEGTRLVATDLRSTNGTIVQSASGSRRMRAGESIVVAPGTRLDLGDDTIVEILPSHLDPSSEPGQTAGSPP